MSYGLVNIDGKNYIERVQVFPLEVPVTVNLSVQSNLRVVLPGVAPFLLKGLTRDTVVAGAPAVRRFKFRLGNTDGAVWYVAGGVGGTTDRVIDPLIFGTAQFPFALVPPIMYGASSSILVEVEDVSNNQPYTIFMGFHGSYLIPV